jgi:hypothetical protein
MVNYFPVALTGMTRSWLINLPEGTLDSWSEMCHQFTANFESAYAQSSNEIDLHAIQQRPGESLRTFVQRFSQVRNTIPRISNASVVVAFRQGVRVEKMLEKLATHDVAKGESKPNAGAQAQGGGNSSSNNNKKAGGNQPLAGAQSARCTTPRAIARRSAGRSRSSQNNSVKRCSSSAKMARLPANGRASRRWTH